MTHAHSPVRSIRHAAAWVAVLLLPLGCSSGSDSAEPYEEQRQQGTEAASLALEGMREAAEAGDWETYVDRFYGEQHKFASPDERDRVVERFRDQWGEQVLPVLAEASQLTPRIVGDRALFEQNGELIFILHKDDDGRWTFHL